MMGRLIRVDNRLQLFTEYKDVDKCKSILGGAWNKQIGCWQYPLEALPFVLEVFPNIPMDKSVESIRKALELKEKGIVGLKEGKVEPRPHEFLMKHQRVGRDIAQLAPKYALYYDVGTGKTILAYAIIEERIQEKWLVICPKSIINTAWVQDGKDFFPNVKVLPIYAEAKADMYMELAEKWGVLDIIGYVKPKYMMEELMAFADVVVTNVEYFKIRDFIKEWPHNGVIVDESSILRNKDTQNTKAIIEHTAKKEYTYLLSGKPAPNNELEYFPQMLIVDASLFGNSYYRFRARYFQAQDFFQRDWQMLPDKRSDFTKRLAKGCMFIRKEDCLDLPPELPPMMRTVKLSKEARKYYQNMERDRVVELDDKYISAAMKVSSLMKLRQITSGFIIDTEEETTSVLHKDKLNELADVVTELGDNKAVIWVSFKEEVRAISELLDNMGKTYSTAYSGTEDLDDSITRFKTNEAQFMIANPKSLKFGVTFTGPTMTKNCTYAIYYSMTHSYEDYYQSKHRIYRKGQTESCTYIYLIAEESIDEDIYESIVRKGTDAEIIENLVRRVKHEK